MCYFQVQNKEEENRALQQEMSDARRKHEVRFLLLNFEHLPLRQDEFHILWAPQTFPERNNPERKNPESQKW
jgi:hypothetical protein